MLDNTCTCMFVIGKYLAMLTSTRMIPICLNGDSVPVKGVLAVLLADSSPLPSHHSLLLQMLQLLWLGEISNSAQLWSSAAQASLHVQSVERTRCHSESRHLSYAG